ncbi:Hypothetical_protein [Hexamita inflata]|uniref:Hypothetical_protein n=1 Tax=Hexamita inflata TaxID=28002 RepID=A0ABP1I8W3_9EUKA
MQCSHELIVCLAVLAMYTFVILFKYLLPCTIIFNNSTSSLRYAISASLIQTYNLEFEYAMNCKCELLFSTRYLQNQTQLELHLPMQNTEFIDVAHIAISNLADVELHLTNI